MKKLLPVLIAVISLVSFESNAQSFQKGENIFNAGFGFGYYGYGYGYGRSFSIPAITANYEIGVGEFIGVGPYVGYASWNYSDPTFDGGYSILALGGRATFHLTDVLFNEAMDLNIDDEWDIYATLILGMNFDAYTGDFTANESNRARISFGPILGVRYYFNEKFAGYLEGGRGSFSYGTIGISVKM